MVMNTILAEQLFMAGNLEWEPRLVPKAGLYRRGLLKSLMTWAIPTPTAEYSLKPVCRSLFQLLVFCRHLPAWLTPM